VLYEGGEIGFGPPPHLGFYALPKYAREASLIHFFSQGNECLRRQGRALSESDRFQLEIGQAVIVTLEFRWEAQGCLRFYEGQRNTFIRPELRADAARVPREGQDNIRPHGPDYRRC